VIAEYLEHAHEFEWFAGLEHDPKVKATCKDRLLLTEHLRLIEVKGLA
jgi:hypothetical protein